MTVSEWDTRDRVHSGEPFLCTGGQTVLPGQAGVRYLGQRGSNEGEGGSNEGERGSNEGEGGSNEGERRSNEGEPGDSSL